MDIPIPRPLPSSVPAARPGLAPLVALALAVAVAALVVLAYRGIELNGFHFDDWPNILYRRSLQMEQLSFAALVEAGRDAFLARRPVASVSFALDWWRGGGAPGPFLVTNLALHVLAAWAVFALLVAAWPARAARTPLVLVAVAAATAWWALQPIQVQAVSYVVQRMTGLAALFSVLTVWAYVRGRRSTLLAHALAWWALALVAFALGALSKENAWITPALVLMAEYLVVREDGPLVRGPLDRALLALPLVGLAAVVVDVATGGPLSRWALYGYEHRDFTLAERLLTQPKVVLFHVSQLLWPLPGRFAIEHDLTIVRSAASWHFWLPMAVIVAWCAAALALAARPGRRLVAFFMLWVPATLVIESSAVPLEMVFEHRMYLPSVGFAGLIAIALAAALEAPRLRLPAAALATAAIGFALWATAERLPHWRSETSLYEQAVRLAPGSARAWNHLGVALLDQRRNEPLTRERYEGAIAAFERSIAADARYAAPWTNMGVARYLQGDKPAARANLERAIALSPKEAPAFHYLAQIHREEGRDVEARQARHRACLLGLAADCYR